CYPRDTQTGAYFVWARTAGIRICDAECICPLGKYGICPHVAAVLLHYVRNPASFRRSWWQRLFGFKHRVERVAVTPDTGQTTPVQNPPHRQNVA
ncbi:MAG TPA: hypothetical protein PKA06_08830, partial [Gemmatales bacterium]|nr:hypothetical protein [Gemmatales bacterium]